MSGVEIGLSIRKMPDIGAERSPFFSDLLKTAGIMYNSLNFSSGADHSFRVHNPLGILFFIFCYFFKIKSLKTFPEDFPLLYHHVPVEAALHDFHHQKFKLFLIIMKRDSPLFIMITDHFIITCTPWASVHSASPSQVRSIAACTSSLKLLQASSFSTKYFGQIFPVTS